jgi:hypothetical protein
MKYFNFIVIGIVLITIFSGCADVEHVQKCVSGSPYGFWGGLWHGIIAPLAFVGSWFDDSIAVYAVNNNGGWYNFGFILGIGGISFGGGSKTITKKIYVNSATGEVIKEEVEE